MTDHDKDGCLAAIFGLAILCLAGFGLLSIVGALTYEHYEEIPAHMVLTAVAGVVGLVFLVGGMASLSQGEPNDPSASSHIRPPEERLCPNCGCLPKQSSKTCEWCGADVK